MSVDVLGAYQRAHDDLVDAAIISSATWFRVVGLRDDIPGVDSVLKQHPAAIAERLEREGVDPDLVAEALRSAADFLSEIVEQLE